MSEDKERTKANGENTIDDPWNDEKPAKEGWPRGVREMPWLFGNEGMPWGYDRDGFVYFKGKQLALKKKVTLRRFEQVLAVLTTAAAICVAVVELLAFLGFSSPQNCH
jgi:hypothetical protein